MLSSIWKFSIRSNFLLFMERRNCYGCIDDQVWLYLFCLVFLSVFVLKLTKYCPCLLRRRYTLINGLSASFMLCYARCTRTCFQILDNVCLYDEHFKCLRKVVFYSGNMEPFHGAHIKYASVALLFLICIVIIPPALLLFYSEFSAFVTSVNLELPCICGG